VAQFRALVGDSGNLPEDTASLSRLPNHPVASITWDEALKYCAWLTERLRAWTGTPEPLATLLRQDGWRITLPSEAEWEKAARGADGRIYAWGNEPDPNRANYDATAINATSAVGCFPGGASPSGVEELSGNVWEWTRSLYGKYPYPTSEKARAQREDLHVSDEKSRMLRGGAFSDGHGNVRCACRNRNHPHYRYWLIGFRVVVRPCS
jgi:formylglycine-generating enzyme required for sulfatase activity